MLYQIVIFFDEIISISNLLSCINYLAVVVAVGGRPPPPKARWSPNLCAVDAKEPAGPNNEDGCPNPECAAAEMAPVDTLVGPALGTG